MNRQCFTVKESDMLSDSARQLGWDTRVADLGWRLWAGGARVGRGKGGAVYQGELKKLGWSEEDLSRHRKGEQEKVRIAFPVAIRAGPDEITGEP